MEPLHSDLYLLDRDEPFRHIVIGNLHLMHADWRAHISVSEAILHFP